MVRAARLYQRVVQVGTQQRSAPQFAQAVEYVKSGQLGRIRLVRTWAYLDWKAATPKAPDGPPPDGVDYDLWLGPARSRSFNPNRFHFTFRWYWDYSGGLMTDWGAHMVDIANWGMGVRAPVSAFSAGGKFAYPDDAMETPDTQQVTWAFPHFSMIWEHALGVGRGPEAREHGVAFHGEDGVLVVDRFAGKYFPKPGDSKTSGAPTRPRGCPGRGSDGTTLPTMCRTSLTACAHARTRWRMLKSVTTRSLPATWVISPSVWDVRSAGMSRRNE